ncbi:MAG: hypothetical protein IPK27_08335 [Rhodanobacteraceae bacterium]|nr:hypothetical protein [Rhodanobacteraceae bacterium]
MRIDERTGAVTAIVTSETSLANLAVDVSPSGRYLIMSWGAEARARIRDLSAGTELDVDLSDVVPTDVPPRIPDMPMGRGVFEFHCSPDEAFHVAARFEAYQNLEPVSSEKSKAATSTCWVAAVC